MLDKIKDTITSLGYICDPCEPTKYSTPRHEYTYTLITFYHPKRHTLCGSISVTEWNDGEVVCNLSPFNVTVDAQHCLAALKKGLLYWNEYGGVGE